MTDAQKNWLAEHPGFSAVRDYPVVSFRRWTDKGYLFDNGKFVPDDGQTLFPHKYPTWFKTKAPAPLLVGREYEIA